MNTDGVCHHLGEQLQGHSCEFVIIWHPCSVRANLHAACSVALLPLLAFLSTTPLQLITQYFDTLKDIGLSGKSNTVFMPHSPGTLGDVSNQIRSGFMQVGAGLGLRPAAVQHAAERLFPGPALQQICFLGRARVPYLHELLTYCPLQAMAAGPSQSMQR